MGKRKRPERRTEVLKMTSIQGLGFRDQDMEEEAHRVAADDSVWELNRGGVAREDNVEPVGEGAVGGRDRVPRLAAHDDGIQLAILARVDLKCGKARGRRLST